MTIERCILLFVYRSKLILMFLPILLKILTYHSADAFSTTRISLSQKLQRNQHARKTTTSSSQLRMVFDMPDSGLERITTQDLIDRILDESVRTSARRPIMRQFNPASKSIWKHWKGTVVAETWKESVRHALFAIMVYVIFKKIPSIANALSGFHRIWGETLAVTTFVLTFFVSESYSCWRNCLSICFKLQGRLNDFSMALAGCAKRIEPTYNNNNNTDESSSTFTPESRKVLLIIARYVRLFNLLSYASFTRSHRPLLTPQGMRRMVSRGLLTEKERKVLINSPVAATSRHNQVLSWMLRVALDARRAGHFDGGFGFEQNLLLRIQEIRAQGNSLQVALVARMPFGYAHIVQVLVDAVCWFYPIMAYSSGLSFHLGLLGVIFLTMSYQGLFDLSKRFLDPFHNENFWNGDDPIFVDTLLAQTNAGSLRWLNSLDVMPITFETIKNGDLDDFVLPNEGYSVDEITQMEAEKLAAAAAAKKESSTVKEDEESSEPSVQEEFEQTKAILNAPPGYDFVPGLDDKGESISYMDGKNRTDTGGSSMNVSIDHRSDLSDSDRTSEELFEKSNKLFEQYMETAEEEYEEALEEIALDEFFNQENLETIKPNGSSLRD